MSDRNTYLELDTYRLVKKSVQVPCYLCSSGNGQDAEFCQCCGAPMALAHQADVQRLVPQMIAAVGAPGAGKTVYLGMLMDMLSRGRSPLQLFARGAFSISLQQETIGALRRCEFPDPTPTDPQRWNWVHCQVTTPERYLPLELMMPDLAGESLESELEHPHSYPVVRSLLRDAGALLVLLDAERIERGDAQQDFFTMKVLSYVRELSSDASLGWPSRPVAFVFTKADLAPSCFDDPALYAARNLPGLVQHCRERFRRFKFFAAGVAGALGYRRLRNGAQVPFPLRVEPRGIVEPLAWLVKEL